MARPPNRASKTNRSKSASGGLVYSTDKGRVCPNCLRTKDSCQCRQVSKFATGGAANDGVVRLHYEKKGRKGKGVTLVQGLVLAEVALSALAKRLKSGCGVGGTVKADVIELQTADREKVKAMLEAEGYVVKFAGGKHKP